MKNTSRKLFISVFALLFAVVAVATTSFAWFTISGKARVDEFQLNISTGEGIQVQLTEVGAEPTTDGWRNVITAEDLQTLLSYESLKLEHLTSTDATTFNQIIEDPDTKGTYIEAPYAGTDLLEFDLHFRANVAYTIHMTEESKVTSTLVTLTPAWARMYDEDGAAPENLIQQTYSAYAANAMRVGFVFDANHPIWAPTDEAVVDESTNKPYGYTNTSAAVGTNPRNYALDGAYEFFTDYMDAVNDNGTGTYLPAAPETTAQVVFGNDHDTEDLQDLVTLVGSDVAYVTPFTQYGKMTVRIWLEGWDGDCYNVLYNSNFKTTLAFEGIVPQA